jgi:hypothetical protein
MPTFDLEMRPLAVSRHRWKGNIKMYFTFSIPCITNQLLHFEPTNALNAIKS